MSKELPKAYDPQKYEDSIYKKWEESDFFNPDTCVKEGVCKQDADAFSIVLPPPNVTGHLHIGHAVMLAIQDIMVRYHRMKGDKTLWVPGTDHAAIATQSKVEKLLWEEEKKTRHDFGREKFLKKVEKFAKDSHDVIVNQSKKMGSSLDWSREVYTLDEERSLAVRTAFKKMYDEGLIYRGHRIVNWDPKMQTTVSDDEVERKEEKAPFYYFQYGPFEIGTARPETKFGDKYVVMHPDDKRYKKYKHKQKIKVEWIHGEVEATVIKDKAIDMEFGTGVMTITPWHDMTDFDIAERHNLDKEQIIDYDGKLMPVAGEFIGLDIKEGRKKIVAKLKEKGLLVKTEENYLHNIAINSRGGGIIEPQIKKQWFIGVNKEFEKNGKKTTLKKLMQDAVRSKKIDIVPERFEKTYFHWIDNLRDWCISRQIWFGHQIPVWYKTNTGSDHEMIHFIKKDLFKKAKIKNELEFINLFCKLQTDRNIMTWGSNDLDKKVIQLHQESVQLLKDRGFIDDRWIEQNRKNKESLNKSELFVGLEAPDEMGWTQDPDTLDTWFSSGLWTFSPLGWPNKTKDLKTYHPTNVMETGYDILFFWVARMILMTTYLMDEVPFEKVYLHGLVRDEKGRKMSKSLGNVIDPLDIIPKYGTDAIRLSLVIGSTPGNDVRLSEKKIAGYRNFTNKLWNISRFILQRTSNEDLIANSKQEIKIDNLSVADIWIIRGIMNLICDVKFDIDNFNFSAAGEKLRDFTWNDFADWYLEVTKFEKNENQNIILIQILKDLLKLWHPFMPFVTERIWKEIDNSNFIMVEHWPDHKYYEKIIKNTNIPLNFKLIKDIIFSIRARRAEYRISPAQKIKAVIYAGDKVELIKSQVELIKNMRTGISELEITGKGEKIKQSIYIVVKGVEIYIPSEGLIDIKQEEKRLQESIATWKEFVKKSKNKLDNKEFIKNAPKELVQKEIEKMSNYEDDIERFKEQIKHLK